MNRNVVVSCAVTGSGDTVDKHPAIPVTPKDIATAAIEAAKAGAAIAHIHVRDPDTGKSSRRVDLYAEVVVPPFYFGVLPAGGAAEGVKR